MRKLLAAASTSLLAAGFVSLATPASGADTCRGTPVTIVDDGGPGTLTGTAGPDVISAQGRNVESLGGDDLVCVAGATVSVDAGTGDDTVDTTGVDGASDVDLGAGDDVFYGGHADDHVTDGPTFTDSADSDLDEIRTGAGRDNVWSGNAREANHDRIFLGPGLDRLSIVPPEPDGSVDLGAGPASVVLYLWTSVEKTWTVDASVWAAGSQGADVSWVVSTGQMSPTPTLVFLGTPGDDDVSMPWSGFFPQLIARLGAGDDRLAVLSRTADGSSYELGRGHDSLLLNDDDGFGGGTFERAVRMDLAKQRFDYGTLDRSTIRGVEDVRLSGQLVSLVGTSASERFTVNACSTFVQGGAGDDVVRRGAAGLGKCKQTNARFEGGRGRDVLVGQRRSNEVLVGGRGFDTARAGAGGFDRCQAEVTRNCERLIG